MSRSGIASFCRIVLALCVVVPCVGGLLTGCQTAQIGQTGLKVPVPSLSFIGLPWPGLGEGDLRGLTWENAFIAMSARMSREYPFTEWKAIDWAALDKRFRPRVKAAQDAGDAESYYLAVREYLYSIPDGHIGISDVPEYRKRAIGGGFGLALTKLDDGRAIAHAVEPGGPAAKAGMAWGAELTSWNGRALAEAAAATPVLWANEPPSTAKVREHEQYRLLTRAPVGAGVKISFLNPGAKEPVDTSLTAHDDAYRMMETGLAKTEQHEASVPFEASTLESGHGYIRMAVIGATLSVPFPDRAFAKALQEFIDGAAPGLIIDLRRNRGGSDALAAKYCGHFFNTAQHYKFVESLDTKRGAFVRNEDQTVEIAPAAPYFAGPVVALIDGETMDAGEGIVAALKRLPNVRTVGASETHGSFASTGGGMELPKGHTVFYPVGRALDVAGKILLESDRAGVGGVQPDVRIEATRGNLKKIHVQGEDLALARAQDVLKEMLAGK
jgi:carboxyl-terminal processing protease